jgi:hypothetical protein
MPDNARSTEVSPLIIHQTGQDAQQEPGLPVINRANGDCLVVSASQIVTPTDVVEFVSQNGWKIALALTDAAGDSLSANPRRPDAPPTAHDCCAKIPTMWLTTKQTDDLA